MIVLLSAEVVLSCCPMRLSVVIVHYQVPAHLEQCLCSLQEALDERTSEIIVVDNDGEVGAIANLSLRFPAVHWISAGKNIGFAAGCNLGWRKSKGEAILFLNPDTLVTSLAMTRCLKALQQADAVGCRLIDGRGRFLPESKRSIPRGGSAFLKMTGLAAVFPQSAFFNQYARGEVPDHASCEIDVLTGAFLMAKRNVLELLNGFDESYFLYGEDVDFCKRMKEAGLTLRYEGEDAVIHSKGSSSISKTGSYFHHFYRAMSVYVQKHYFFPLSFLFRMGIYFREWAHRLYHQGSLLFFPPQPIDPIACHWWLMGDESDMKALADLLKKKWGEQLRISLLSPAENNYLQASGLVAPNNILVFCVGALKLESIIRKIEVRQSAPITLYWHNESHSMAGSGRSYLFNE